MAPRIDTIAESAKFYTWHGSTMYFGTFITAPLETAALCEPMWGLFFSPFHLFCGPFNQWRPHRTLSNCPRNRSDQTKIKRPTIEVYASDCNAHAIA